MSPSKLVSEVVKEVVTTPLSIVFLVYCERCVELLVWRSKSGVLFATRNDLMLRFIF